ncbi:MAG TPA: hypothetical protein VLW17_11775 [Thermoanaerobaculaceae bacterium]|nr:hypothetical protein [Thermoanaerobaculaceae bacterium]
MTEFDAARRAALMQDLLATLTGRPLDLLPFDAVREGLWLKRFVDRGVEEVPLDRVVGTLGREREFNRAFLPREESLRERWERMRGLAEGPAGFAPVELYKVGGVYFVVDGHHRVSVARALGQGTIEAAVKEYPTPVPLDAGATAADVLVKRFLADFLEATGLQPDDPDEYRLTEVDGYERLLEHINVHRYYRGIETGRPVEWQEAVASWRDSVFRPMVAIIRSSGVMAEFPGRTEADLYLFTMDHLHHLRQRYAAERVGPALAVRHFRLFVAGRSRLRDSLRAWWQRRRAGRGAGAADNREADR